MKETDEDKITKKENTLIFNSISFSVPNPADKNEPKKILKDISGTVNSGQVLAILGPSGVSNYVKTSMFKRPVNRHFNL